MLGRTPISDDALPARPGDNTPPGSWSTGRQSCQAGLADAPSVEAGTW